ncbi:DUF5615 family PIN-like protein [Crenothrix sp.]|uniref:DUF5615 family PIN-like protein n=1 Tax=Crenothrix sp. TaxID=3100433 RepID=UPI00374D1F50
MRNVTRLLYGFTDATHTLDLPEGNRTTDTHINRLSEFKKRVVITKDTDYVNSFLYHINRINCFWFLLEIFQIRNLKQSLSKIYQKLFRH